MPRCAFRWVLLAALTWVGTLGLAAGMEDPKPPRVRLSTSKGVIVVELDPQKAPISVANFLGYVRSGHYDSTIFHRVMPSFMIQGGGFTSHLDEKPVGSPIKGEADNGLSNLRGTLAMAKLENQDNATAQFFINVKDNRFLDFPAARGGGYTVFGRVIEGLDVVDAIRVVPTRRVGLMGDVPILPILIERAEILFPGSPASGAPSKASTPAEDQSREVRWRLASGFPGTGRGPFHLSERLCKRVLELTDGRFQISAYAGGKLTKVRRLALEVGRPHALDAGHAASIHSTPENTAFSFDSGLPFGPNERQHRAWMQSGGGLELMRELYRRQGLINFPGGSVGSQKGLWSRREIRSLKDLQGLKVNIQGFGARVFSALGAVTLIIPPSEVEGALQHGILDATEWSGPYELSNPGLNEVAKFYYPDSWWEPSTHLTFFVNLEAWVALPRAYQVAFETACGEADANLATEWDPRDPGGVKWLAEQGTLLKTYPPDVIKAAQAATKKVLEEEAARNRDFNNFYESWQRFLTRR